MPFLSTALAVGIGAAAAGSVASSAIGAHAAGKAADTQANAADQAAQLQKQSADEALAFQKQEFATQQKNEAPFLATGTQAAGQLKNLTSTPGSGLLTPWTQTFQAPTLQDAQNEPGYQFALQQGTHALESSAAAKGNLFSGTQGAALQNYGQQLGEQDYGNVYNRALQQYQQNYNIFNQNQSNEFNRLSALAGGGQTAAGQLGQEGQAAASNEGNISLTSGAQQGQDLQNAAAAQASGYVGGANAINGGISSLANLGTELPLYSQLLQNQSPGGSGFSYFGGGA